MFKFLKEKLSKAVSIFSRKVEEEAEVKKAEPVEEPKDKHDMPFAEPEKKQERPAAVPKKEIPAEKIKTGEQAIAKKPEPEKEITEEPEAQDEEHVLSGNNYQRTIFLEEEKDQELADASKEEPEQKIAEELGEEPGILPDISVEEMKELGTPEKDLTKTEEEMPLPQEYAEMQELVTEFEGPKQTKEKPSFFKRLFGKKEKKDVEEAQEAVTLKKEGEIKEAKETAPEQEKKIQEKPGFFEKIKESITTVKLSDEKFDKIFWELELAMLENNVAVEVIDKIKADLRHELTSGKVSRKGIEEIVHDSLKSSVEGLFEVPGFDLVQRIKSKSQKPFVIAFIGVNGSGKTTTMAKVANLLLKNKLSVVFAASDTFRAAAIQQLQEHADRLGVKMIRHDYESDPAAVAFDAIKHAQAKGIDVVLIDTAGRLHTNDNLMNELKKLARVNQPDLKIFIGESITGNDCVEQAKLFDEAVGIDAIILAKADVDEKGGAALSVGYVTKKPILYIGTGQGYDDLAPFDPDTIIKNIGL